MIDLNGNPLIVSGVVVYYWEDTKKAALEVVDRLFVELGKITYELREGFVFNQALAVMKHIVGQYPYEHLEDKDHEKADTIEDEKVVFRPPKRAKKPCLKTDSDVRDYPSFSTNISGGIRSTRVISAKADSLIWRQDHFV